MSIADFTDNTAQPTGWVDPDAATAPVEAPVETPAPQVEPQPAPAVTAPVAQTPAAAQDEILNSLLNHMSDIGTKSYLKVLIYGDPGTTKSSFAATAPNNLIVDLDDGLLSAKTSPNGIAQNVKAFPWVGFNGLEALLFKLKERPPALDWIEVVTIDPFSETHKRGLDEVLAREHSKAPRTFNRYAPETEHHAENNNRMLDIVRQLKDLDRNLLIIAHARTVEPKGKLAKTFPDFSESLANKIEGMMDLVGYMTRREVDGNMVPVLRVHTDGTVHAKTRLPLPIEIANPTWPMIQAAFDSLK